MSATPEQIAEAEERAKALLPAIMTLMEYGIPADVQELLVCGSPHLGIRAGALQAAITSAQAERVRVLESALRPFADEAALWADMWADDFHPVQDTSVSCSQCGESMEKPERARFTIGDLRRARAALKGEA